MDDHLAVLRERAEYLDLRIVAKETLGWEVDWDRRELAALQWAIGELEAAG
jgi:hypothetical protein